MRGIRYLFRSFLWLAFFTGVVYPLVVTTIAQLIFPYQANGSFIYVPMEGEEKRIGSELIAQKFENPKYFWPRPSAVNFNPLPSGGSNLGPTSAVLKKAVAERKSAFGDVNGEVPSDLLFASGSGIDPHISPAAAYFQIDRILQSRPTLEREVLEKLIEEMKEEPRFYIFGAPSVNVLKLNLGLDER